MLKKEICNFGEHLTIDGYGGDQGRLNDRKIIYNCLDKLPKKIGMNKLADPQVYSAPDNENKDPGGWSGFVIVAESHISIHTFPKREFASIDVYTCKNGIKQDFIVDYFCKKFKFKKVEINLLMRGREYPNNNIHK
jgi:S-adenosylmethionine decarboxylase